VPLPLGTRGTKGERRFRSRHLGRRSSALICPMVFWAVVSDEINQVIEFFQTRWQAERMLAEALRDEPDWRGILRVEKIERPSWVRGR
jgi:hypothetical protein